MKRTLLKLKFQTLIKKTSIEFIWSDLCLIDYELYTYTIKIIYFIFYCWDVTLCALYVLSNDADPS